MSWQATFRAVLATMAILGGAAAAPAAVSQDADSVDAALDTTVDCVDCPSVCDETSVCIPAVSTERVETTDESTSCVGHECSPVCAATRFVGETTGTEPNCPQ